MNPTRIRIVRGPLYLGVPNIVRVELLYGDNFTDWAPVIAARLRVGDPRQRLQPTDVHNVLALVGTSSFEQALSETQSWFPGERACELFTADGEQHLRIDFNRVTDMSMHLSEGMAADIRPGYAGLLQFFLALRRETFPEGMHAWLDADQAEYDGPEGYHPYPLGELEVFVDFAYDVPPYVFEFVDAVTVET